MPAAAGWGAQSWKDTLPWLLLSWRWAFGGSGRGGRAEAPGAEGSSPREEAHLGHGGAGACSAPGTPCPPQPQCSTSPHRCVHQHRLPRAPRAGLQLKEGADGQTDKQTRSCTIPSLYCSLQLAAAAQQTRALCAPNPSLSSAGAARRGRGFPRAEAPGAEHLPARGGCDEWHGPSRVGAGGAGGRPWGSEVVGTGEQPRALVLPGTSKSCGFSWSRLPHRLLIQAAPLQPALPGGHIQAGPDNAITFRAALSSNK